MASLAMGTPAAPSFGEKLWRINWGLILVLTAIAAVGTVALYSAAGGRFDPWAARHALTCGLHVHVDPVGGNINLMAVAHPSRTAASPRNVAI